MNRFFNMDNKFFTFMSKVADLILLNLLFLICCIPIVTIGASWTALYYVTMKIVRNEESYITKSFFKSFKENFKQSTVIWVILLILGIMLIFDYQIISIMEGTFIKVIRYGLMVITTIYVFTLIYTFPLLSKFENTTKNTLKNALLMSIRHLPFTFLMAVVTVAPFGATLLIPVVMIYGAIVWLLAGFAIIAFINSCILVKIFDKYIPAEAEKTENNGYVQDPSVFKNLSPGNLQKGDLPDKIKK